jgi:transposase
VKVHREDQWYRDWVSYLTSRSERAADVAEIASLAVARAYEVLDKTLEAVLEAKAKTAAARDRACKTKGAAVDGWRRSPNLVQQPPAALHRRVPSPS